MPPLVQSLPIPHRRGAARHSLAVAIALLAAAALAVVVDADPWVSLALLTSLGAALLVCATQFRRSVLAPATALVALIRARAAGDIAPPAAFPPGWHDVAAQVDAAFSAERTLVAQLRAAEALKAGVIAASLDAVVTTDGEMRVVAFNPAAERMFGWTEAEALGQPVGALVVPDHMRPMHDAGVARYHATGTAHVLGRRVELEARRRGGEVFPVELLLQEVKLADGRFFTAFLRDLTPERRAAAELTASRERLHQAEKMSALGSLLAGVAHELNNPLSVVTMQATMLEEQAEGSPLAERAGRIQAAAQRCARIVRSFLAMVRQQPPQRGPVRLGDVLHAALDLLAYGLRSNGILVRLEIAPDLPVIEGDADQLLQVAVNLIANAQQAMAASAGARQLLIAAWRDGDDAVACRFADSGPGVPEALRERVFEPYFTTKPLGAGTGIGLAVCRGIAAAHRGSLRLEAGHATGACFVLRLPVGTPSAGGSAATVPPPMRPGQHVLVIDDEPDVGGAVADALHRHGVAATVAATRAAAETALALRPFDAVFCDLRMPDGGGAAIWRAAIAVRPGLAGRFVFVTGDTVAGPSDIAAVAADAPILEKPFTLPEVGLVLRRIGLAAADPTPASPASP